EQQWPGTRDISAFLAVPEALRFCAAHDWPRVRAQCHALAAHARARLGELTGLPPICPDSPDWYAQMAAVRLPPGDGPALKARLWEQFRVEVPVHARPEGNYLRVSIQAYNSGEDVERLLAGLRQLLPAKA
ncbi:MAG TPA: hypothetical protein VMF63_08835, partial [Opitutaceae bacterium]|nr:hypothetical protein [Opitutaceae bacterium]